MHVDPPGPVDAYFRQFSFAMEDGNYGDFEPPSETEPVEDDEFDHDLEAFDMALTVGATYVRWGRSDCPVGRELVYHGRAGGSHYTHSGGGSNYQCLPLDPQNFDFGPGGVDVALMYGSEYEMYGHIPKANLHLHEHDVPCAVCYVPGRSAVLMVPAKYTCPPKWTREYYGWLMAERYNHHRTTFECVDVAAQKAHSGHPNHNGALFYHVEPRVGSLPGPPYDNQKELTCAVCTR